MLRVLCVSLFSVSAFASSLDDVDQTLPSINVKFDFPSSSTVVSAKERLDIVNRDAVFMKRVRHVQQKVQHLSNVLETFARGAHDQLGAVLSIVQPLAASMLSQDVPPSFLQVVEQKQRLAGVSMDDVEKLAQDAEFAGEIYSSAAQDQPTQKDEQQSILEGNVETLGAINEELLHEKHLIEDAQSMTHCTTCARNHDTLCPEGWSEGVGGSCNAPDAYDGPCMAFAYFGGLSDNDKIGYERRCLVCWPCS